MPKMLEHCRDTAKLIHIHLKNRNISHFLATSIAHTEGSLLPVANTSNDGLWAWATARRDKPIMRGRVVRCDVTFLQTTYCQRVVKSNVTSKI